MLTHNAAWDTYPVSGFRPAVRVTAHSWGAVFPDLDVPVTDGWVLKDAGQYPRTHIQVTCADTSLVPTTLMAALQPLGGWLRVEYGYTDTAGVTTYLTIADGPITRVSARRPDGLLMVEAADPSVLPAGIVAYTDNPQTAGGTVRSYISSCAQFSWNGGTDATALSAAALAQILPTDYVWKAGQSLWAEVEAASDLLGAETYIRESDRMIVIRPVPTIGTPVFTFTTGESGTITEYESAMERPVNVVRLVFANGVVGNWSDSDPNSRTQANPTTKEFDTNMLVENRSGTPTQAEANAAAKEYARRARGTGRSLLIRAVPVPWLEPGDTVTVDPDGLPAEQHLIQSVSIPLGLDAMTVTTRNPVYAGIL